MSTAVLDTGEAWISASDVARERAALDPNGTHGDDPTYENCAVEACQWIEFECGSGDFPRQFLLGTRTEVFLKGNGGFRQKLPDGPIVSLSEVVLGSIALTIGTRREFASGTKNVTFDGSYLVSNVQLEGPLLVSYLSGYERGKIPVEKCAAWLAAYFYSVRRRHGLESKTEGDSSENFSDELPEWFTRTLKKHEQNVTR